MLLREKILIFVFALACIVFLVDLNTSIGNRIWEQQTKLFDRYAVNQGSEIGYINARGRLVIWPKYSRGVTHFTFGIVPVAQGDKWFYIDRNGKDVFGKRFTDAKKFTEGLAAVAEPGKSISRYGFIDRDGRMVIRPEFMDAKSFSDGIAVVKTHEGWGGIDKDGQWAIAPQYDGLLPFSDGLAAAQIGESWGYVDTNGKIVIAFNYDVAKPFASGLAPVRRGDEWGYINKKGSTIVNFTLADASVFHENLAAFKDEFGAGFIDNSGAVVFQDELFIRARDFSEGLAAVLIKENPWNDAGAKWGYVNRAGDVVIEPRFDWAWDFEGGLARVGIDKNIIQRGYVNQAGELIWDPQNWAQRKYFRQTILSVLTIALFVYACAFISFFRQKKEHYRLLLAEQAEKHNGTILRTGLFSEPKVIFIHGNKKFSIQCVENLNRNYLPGVRVAAEIDSLKEHHFSLYLNVEEKQWKRLNLTDEHLIKASDPEFDAFVKIPKGPSEELIKQLLTFEVKNKLLIFPMKNGVLALNIAAQRFYLDLNGTPRTKDDYDWFVSTALVLHARLSEIDQPL